MKLKIVALILIIITTASSYWVYENTFNHFKLDYITYSGKLENQNLPEPNTEERALLNSILATPFHYLGEGHQSYAFQSQDKKYVLKFFKFKKARKVERIFVGYGLAYTYDRKNCGLLYVHLQPTDNLNKQVTVTDRIGRPHIINLDQVVFVIQEKAKTSKTVLGELLSKGDIEAVKRHLNQIIDLYVAEYKLGLIDQDHNVLQNSGFVNQRFIRTDVGKLVYDDQIKQSDKMMEDLNKIAWERIDNWVLRYFPQNRDKIKEFLAQKLEDIQRMESNVNNFP